MEIYQTEEEQLDAIKGWLQKNGRTLIITLGVVIALVLGYQLWKSSRQSYNQSASLAYQEVLEAAQQADNAANSFIAGKDVASKTGNLDSKTLNTLGNKLIEDYPRSAYAQLTALLLAKQALHDNQLKKAASHLQWILDHHPEDNLKTLTQLRLARVLFASHQLQQAQSLLQIEKDNSYYPLYQELLGDIFVAQHKTAEAKQAYQAALNALSKDDKDKGAWIKTKLENL